MLGDKPIVIISAARSGTKMLRYILDASSVIASYPYDANYIWKYGNYSVRHDEIGPESVNENQKNKIRAFFLKICKKESVPRFLEKSVPNSLRIPFVRSIFPDCKIIHLYRNGLDVTADSRLCWQDTATSERIQSQKDRSRKLKEFPIAMAWPYLLQYIVNYGKKIIFRQDHVSTWGPRYEGIDDDVRQKPLLEVCAKQWIKCVEHCCHELGLMENGRDYINVSYEKLAYQPEKYLQRIVDFIDVPDKEKIIIRGLDTISTAFIKSWKNHLANGEENTVRTMISKTQDKIDDLK